MLPNEEVRVRQVKSSPELRNPRTETTYFPIAVHSHLSTETYTSLIAEEVISDDKEILHDHTILHASSTYNWDSTLMQILLLPFNTLWQSNLIITIIINYFLTTYIYCFDPVVTAGVFLVLRSTDVVYLIDFILGVVHRFWKSLRLQMNVEKRFNISLIVDTITLLPIELIYSIVKGSLAEARMVYILRSVTFLRLYRVFTIFGTWSTSAGSRQWQLFIIKYILYLCLILHTVACVWYSVSYEISISDGVRSWSLILETFQMKIDSPEKWYFISLYFAVGTVSNCGLGDIYATNTVEYIICIVSMLLGFALTTGVYIGALSSQIANSAQRRASYVDLLKAVKRHLKDIKMKPKQMDEILEYYEVLWFKRKGVKEALDFDLLPIPLQIEVCFDINENFFDNSLLFRSLAKPFLRQVALRIKNLFLPPGEIIFHQDVAKFMMICVKSGVVQVLSDEDNESPIISFTPGTCLGEVAMIMNVPSKATVRASTYVELHILLKVDFYRMMVDFPEIFKTIRSNIESRINSAYDIRVKADKEEAVLNLVISKTKHSSFKLFKDKLRVIKGLQSESFFTENKNYQAEIDGNLNNSYLDLYTIADDSTPSTTNTLCVTTTFPWILQPNSDIVNAWDLFLTICIVIVSFLYPYYTGFVKEFPPWLNSIGIVVNTIFILDIYIQCTTAIEEDNELIADIVQIFYHRMNYIGFYFDMFAVFPIEIMSYIIEDEVISVRMSSLMKLNRLFKVWKIPKYFHKLEQNLWTNLAFIRIIKYIVYLSLISHWAGVVLYMEACFFVPCIENSWYSVKMDSEIQLQDINPCFENPSAMSSYYGLTLLSGIGYGDIVPENEIDIAFVCILILLGVILCGYCIAEFSATFTMIGSARVKYQEMVYAIKKYMVENNMKPTIQERVFNYFQLQWLYNGGIMITQNKSLYADATEAIQQQVLTKECLDTISSIPLFQGLNMDFIQLIATGSRMLILPPNEIVTYAGGLSREMYIVKEGFCEVISEIEQKTKHLLGPSSHFGDLEMLFGVPTMVNVQTVTHCKLLSINYSVYSQANSVFPIIMEGTQELLNDVKLKTAVRKFNAATRLYIQKNGNYLQKRKKTNIRYLTTLLKSLFKESFIHVLSQCHTSGEDYSAPFHKLDKFRFIKYLLLPITIVPTGKFIKLWCSMRIVAAITLGIVGLFQQSVHPYGAVLMDIIRGLDIFAFVDMYVMMHVCYFNKDGLMVSHPLCTATHYLTHSFCLDLLACFPFEIFNFLIFENTDTLGDNSFHIMRGILRINRVFQIHRVPEAFHYLESDVLQKADIIRAVKYLPITIILLNMWASFIVTSSCKYYPSDNINAPGFMECKEGTWFMETQFVNFTTHPIDIYMVAYYWVTSTLVGAGFGDVSAQNLFELIVTRIMMTVGMLLFGYMFASIASSKASLHKTLSHYQEMMAELKDFMKQEGVDKDLQKKLENHFEYEWKRTSGVQAQHIFDKLHTALKEDAVLWMYEKTLRGVPIFEHEQQSFFRVIGKHLQESYFLKGSTIIRCNDVQSDIYIIHRGKVEVLSTYNEMMTCMGPGGLFGNLGSKSPSFCSVTIIASRNLDALVIPSNTFYYVLEDYPNVKRHIHALLSQTKDYVVPSTLNDSEFSTKSATLINIEEGTIKGETSEIISTTTTVGTATTIGTGRTITSMMAPQNWFKFAILPESGIFSVLGYFVLISAYLNIIMVTYHFSFQEYSFNFFVISVSTEIIFYIKIILDLHQAYIDKYGEYVTDCKKIRQRYFRDRTRILTEVIPNLPIDVFALFVPYGRKLRVLSCLRLIHLGRLSYIFQYYNARSNLLMVNKLYLKMSLIFIWLTLFAHFFACIWYMQGCPLAECYPSTWAERAGLSSEIPAWESFILSLYYIIALFTCTGFGELFPRKTYELIICISMMILSKFCIANFIGDITTVLSTYTSTLVNYEHGITELRDCLKNQGVSSHQMEKVWHYVKQLWKQGRGKQIPRFILKAPFVLKSEVMNAMYGHHLRHSYIFSNTNEDFLRQLTVRLKHYLFFEGNYIVQHGDSDQQMYFIHRGEVSVLTVHPNLTETIHDVLKPTDMFGLAQGLHHGQPHHFSFRARTIVDVVALNLDDWYYMLKYFPGVSDTIYSRANNLYAYT